MSVKSSISSHVRISYRFYQFVTTWYTTDFYMINNNVISLTEFFLQYKSKVTGDCCVFKFIPAKCRERKSFGIFSE